MTYTDRPLVSLTTAALALELIGERYCISTTEKELLRIIFLVLEPKLPGRQTVNSVFKDYYRQRLKDFPYLELD